MTETKWTGKMASDTVNHLMEIGYDRNTSMQLVGFWIDGQLPMDTTDPAVQTIIEIEAEYEQ